MFTLPLLVWLGSKQGAVGSPVRHARVLTASPLHDFDLDQRVDATPANQEQVAVNLHRTHPHARSLVLTGNPTADRQTLVRLRRTLPISKYSSDSVDLIQVSFGPHAPYQALITVLDVCAESGQSKYAFDGATVWCFGNSCCGRL